VYDGLCPLCRREIGLTGDREAVRNAALRPALSGHAEPRATRPHDRCRLAEAERTGPFDFADRRFPGVIREQAAAMGADRAAWEVPPVDTLFVQCKISGTALLAARLSAHFDIRAKVAAHLAGWSG